ncbi:bacillithiol biosynthesis cysteine-adding enzyme BshC [Chryseobacterium sp. HSC-36S06]|uniref:bacillithiol biosynthesis cysteine-adding enzyme BshC n=1 Tax=Chryseobacterium sp. HSC-36S06 TaxID=2910970 RepID=UPI00209D3981|nr:bacillithiol biosynthesis cysteine-adding enzyme BshC [Chryseobacterium sp. HSC-36S06]MCP2037002.1 bacillithiol biosynthesis cysteine-adding enzyme BshC [Chryseobacterium sp. HSC-36S06]
MTKKHSSISFLDIESIPLLIKDFLTEKIEGFENQLFNDGNIDNQFSVKAREFTSEKRALLFDVLSDQYSGVQLDEKQKENLNSILLENTFTVTTGHQLNLFTGPAFFIYKILQTIKLADSLNENFPDRNIVPIFWMATEDHDFEEINHFKTESNYYETKAKSGGPVGRILVEDDFFISEFEREFKDAVYGTELILLMKKAYKKGNSLAQATRILVQELFSPYGLLVIDGDDRKLKSQMKEVFKIEMLHQELYHSTKNMVEVLAETYGKVQVNPREINLFYLSETRNRIEFEGGKYSVVDTNISFSETELLEELENYPENFSPNALMRPVYQETVLPNLAYIGGNAEIMYWLELKDYYAKIGLAFPVLIPRVSLLFVTEKTLNKTEKSGLKMNDFFKNFATVTKDILLENNEILQLLDQQGHELKKGFDDISAQAAHTDKTFGSLVNAEKTRQLKSFERMRKRLLRAEKIKQNEKLGRLENLFLTVHPGKNWQERVCNFSVFYADYGHEWLQSCYEEIEVRKSELIILSI